MLARDYRLAINTNHHVSLLSTRVSVCVSETTSFPYPDKLSKKTERDVKGRKYKDYDVETWL